MIKIETIKGMSYPRLVCDISGRTIEDVSLANAIWLEDNFEDGSSRVASPVHHVLKEYDRPFSDKFLGKKPGQTNCWMSLDVYWNLLLKNTGFDHKSAEMATRRKLAGSLV